MRALSILAIMAVAALTALGTALGGWWAVPIVGLVAGGVLGYRRRPGVHAALGGAVAWGGILVAYVVLGFPLPGFAARLAGAMQVGVGALLAATVLVPAILAGSAAALAGQLRRTDDAGA